MAKLTDTDSLVRAHNYRLTRVARLLPEVVPAADLVVLS